MTFNLNDNTMIGLNEYLKIGAETNYFTLLANYSVKWTSQ